jgi:hypothetical protein
MFPEDQPEDRQSAKSIQRFWNEQFERDDEGGNEAIQPNFDIFSQFIAQNLRHTDF